MWCKKHGRKGKNGVQSGIYMPDPHVQEDWKERKTPGNSAWKYNKKTRADEKCKATYVEPEPKDKGKNLSLQKSFNTALATKVSRLQQDQSRNQSWGNTP